MSIFSQLVFSSPARTPKGFVSGTSEKEKTATFDGNIWWLGFTNCVLIVFLIL